MKANRFLSFWSLLLVPLALIALAAPAMAQLTLPAPTADNTFGRLSWYTNITNFGGNTAFGLFGQANTLSPGPNPKGFGVFGYGGINGVNGGGFLSVINGTNPNIGAWALGANATGGMAGFSTVKNIGLEVGANQFSVSGLYGWAIRVDSGDVELGGTGGPQNTTYVHNLVIDGSVNGIIGANQFTQNTTAGVVNTAASTAAAIVGLNGATNADPTVLAVDSSNAAGAVVFEGNQTNGAALMQLKNNGTTAFSVAAAGDLAIGANTFTVAAASGKTTITDGATTGAASFNVSNTAGTTGRAVSVTAANSTGFTSSLTNGGNTNFLALTTVSSADVPATGGAAVGITHGLYVDSLRDNQYVDFTGATIKGISGENQYLQPSTGAAVTTTSSTAATLVALSGAGNADPDLVVADSGTGTAVLANATSTGKLLELQKAGTDVVSVDNKGAVTVADATTTGGAALNVNNTAGTTGDAVSVTGSNNVGFTSALTNAGQTNFLALTFDGSGNPITAGPGGAAVGITHGLYVDSLRDNKYVDFTGATIVGISGENDYTQTTAGSAVTTTSATNAALVANITAAANTDPNILLSNASTAGVVIQANQTAGAKLVQLQKSGTDVFDVNGNGQTTITDATTTGASTFNVTNSAGTTGSAMTINGGNTTGFASTLTEPTNVAGKGTNFLAMVFTPAGSSTLTAGGAAVGITHGLFVDSLRDNQYVDFTGATIVGMSGANQYTQKTTGGTVNTGASTAASVVGLSGSANTDPSFLGIDSSTTTGTVFEGNVTGTADLMHLQNNGTDKVVVANGGNTTITTTTGTALVATTSSGTTTDAAVKASGNGAAGAAALQINNGAVRVTGANQPAGVSASITIAAGFRTKTQAVANTLAQANSYIVCTASGSGGDTYSATIISQGAGTFSVKVTDVEGNVLVDTPVTVNYWVVNQ